MAGINRVRIAGTSVTGEVWSTHLDFSLNPEDGDGTAVTAYESLLVWAQNVAADPFWTETGALRSLMSSALSVSTFRIEAIVDKEVVQVAEVDGLTLPGLGTLTKAPQTALVTSLLTGRPGRSYRGRIYWPACGATLTTTTARLSAPANAAVASHVQDLSEAIIAACPAFDDPTLVVYSPTLNIVTRVTQLSVGDVLDTQRRRRDSLQENRATVTL